MYLNLSFSINKNESLCDCRPCVLSDSSICVVVVKEGFCRSATVIRVKSFKKLLFLIKSMRFTADLNQASLFYNKEQPFIGHELKTHTHKTFVSCHSYSPLLSCIFKF